MRLDELGLFVLVRTVHSRDRLQERVVAHWLIEIHCIKDRGVKAG